MTNNEDKTTDFFNRRDFAKLVAAVAACAPVSTLANDSKTESAQTTGESDLLRNLSMPAIQFQASPMGSAAFIERFARDAAADPMTREELAAESSSIELPSTDEEIAFLPVQHLAALIRSRTLSPVRLTDIYLERLKRFNSTLLCAVTVMEASARRDARRAEDEIAKGNYRGPLHGIPWGVKDLFSTQEAVTTWGAKPFERRVIDEDAEVVVRLRNAGAILIAKLATGTFAQGDRWFRGTTRNPWNTEEGSSGSSAGPGSATAAGCVAFAIGTETQGSIVSPARRCGISALRPTFGRVSRHGCMTLSWTMDKVGPMCRTIEDCAIVFRAIHGSDEKDPSTLTAPFDFRRSVDLSKLRIGYTRDADVTLLDKLRELGARPKLLPDSPDPRDIRHILNVESAAAFDELISRNLDELMVRKDRIRTFRASQPVTAVEYLNAQRRRYRLMQEMADYMESIDVYVSGTGDIRLTNLTGHPAAIVPYKIEAGQPRCATLIGNLFADDALLSVAHAYQTATNWHLEHPKLA